VNSRGLALDIQQTAPAAFGTFTARIWKRLYLGAGYLWSDVETRPKLSLVDEIFPDFDPVIDLEMAALMVPIEWDSRDHNVFPRDGWHIKSNITLYRESVGSDFDATTVDLGVNRYIPVRDDDVFALRAYLRSTSGDAPFFLMSSFGGGKDLRGYPSGRYRDRMMYAVQGEYRWQLHRRWIISAFAGVGEVANDWGDFGKNHLPAGGLGLRFVVSEEHRVSLSTDIAVGKDGYEFYFGVNEAF
jgi:outer membrane protein assembly factor BamA